MILPRRLRGAAARPPRRGEAFFILKGHAVKLFFEYEGETWETTLTERDVILVPPGI